MKEWFEIQVIYLPTSFLSEEEDERDPLLKKLKMKAEGEEEYKTDTGFFNIVVDPIMHLTPGYLIMEGVKRYFTTVVFESGNSVTAVGKPERIFKDLQAHQNS